MAQQPNPVVRLQFEFDFSKREFVLRFESRTHAAAYQALNPEARILEGQPRDVWLPYPPEMSSLRSSSLGMAAIFQSLAAAEKWHKRTCLGGVATFSGDHGVYFKRDWSYAELEERLGSRRASLKPLPSPSRSNSPMNDRVIDMRVDRQRASAKR
ncbi:hypothetical protein MKX08_001364 [Trichoderma sp. CBMAI-0020]|nr:hypothetical protein MKX08_001364 [Trichoderma sp. CBMAI-0020]